MAFRLTKALDALEAEQQAIALRAVENVRAYTNAVGIGEHPDLVGAVQEQVKIIADAQDQLAAIKFLRQQDVTMG